MTDEAEWKRGFRLFAILRIGGLLMFLFGVAVAYSDLLKPGGWPLLGGLLAILGAVEAVLIPRVLRKSWDR